MSSHVAHSDAVPSLVPPTSEQITQRLLAQLPRDQWDLIMEQDYYAASQIDPTFLGFVDVYYHLAAIIPRHWTIVDLGCAYAPQAFCFQHHKKFVGADIDTPYRFHAPNTTHYLMRIGEFLTQHGHKFDPLETFAICSYVPMWGENTREHIRAFFPNLFVYYPHGGNRILLNVPQHARSTHFDADDHKEWAQIKRRVGTRQKAKQP